jgi:CheY-like chemotaxis protein
MSNPRILIVEDNPTDLKLVSELLEWSGYDVAKAVNAAEALEALETSRPDLILMDIAMEGMNGLTLTRKLKADGATRDIRIVALTALAMVGDEQAALDAGCGGYITKPIDTRRLAGQIAGLLKPEAHL